MRAPVPYFGSKGLLAPTIAAALDSVPHRHYVEACGGGLSVLLAKRRAHAETANDIDGRRLVTVWRVLRSRPDDLERACSLTPHSAAERALALDFPPDLDELEVARRVYVALTQGRSARPTAHGGAALTRANTPPGDPSARRPRWTTDPSTQRRAPGP